MLHPKHEHDQPSYWKVDGADAADACFRLSDERVVSGTLAWPAGLGPGTVRGRERPIMLESAYALKWREYSDLGGRNGRFRYLVVEVRTASFAESGGAGRESAASRDVGVGKET